VGVGEVTKEDLDSVLELASEHDAELTRWRERYDYVAEQLAQMHRNTPDKPFICRQCHRAGVPMGYDGSGKDIDDE
jgi:hypothetical protein